MAQPDLTRRSFMRSASTSLIAAAALPAAAQLAGAQPATTQLAPPDKQPPNLRIPPRRDKVGYAVVGLGVLSINEILPAFGKSKLSMPAALVSGHPDKAKALADVYGVGHDHIYNYENYDKILDDDTIDVVFNVLPNHMHAEYTIRALRAKKHVLCEKPMAASVEECRAMIAAAKENDRKLMIAYRLHYEPHHIKLIELARSGELGKLKLFEAQNCQTTKAPNIRLSKETAGGPLGDVGVYCLNAARYTLGEEPTEVFGYAHQPTDDPNFAEVFESVVWQMKFPSGAIAMCNCSFGTARSSRLRVVGTKGSIDLDPAFPYSGQKLTRMMGEGDLILDLPSVDHFAAEMDHFAEVVQGKTECKTPGEEGLKDMIVVDAVHRSIREGRPIKVEMNV